MLLGSTLLDAADNFIDAGAFHQELRRPAAAQRICNCRMSLGNSDTPGSGSRQRTATRLRVKLRKHHTTELFHASDVFGGNPVGEFLQVGGHGIGASNHCLRDRRDCNRMLQWRRDE